MAIDLATAAPEAFKTASASQPLIPPSPPSLPTIHSPMIYNTRLALHLQKDRRHSPTLHVSVVQKSTTYIPIPTHPSHTNHSPNAQTPFPRTSKSTHRVDQCGFHPYSTSTSISTAFFPPTSDLRLRRGLHPANPHATVPHPSQVK